MKTVFMEATSVCSDKDSYDLNFWLMLALFNVYGVIEKTQHNTFHVLKENVILINAFEDVNRKDSQLHPPQELEVRSLNHPYSLKTKSSQCHYVVTP